MICIYGLGNPGRKYELTRHNMGFMVVDLLSIELNIAFKKTAANMAYGSGNTSYGKLMLAKPMTFMNLSGKPLSALGLKANDLIVVHDDVDIPLGDVRIKSGGGAGGHKGLISIIDEIKNRDFVRIRCGIGRPPEDMDTADYVLRKFAKDEFKIVSDEIRTAAEAILEYLSCGLEKTMNIYNQREKLLKPEA